MGKKYVMLKSETISVKGVDVLVQRIKAKRDIPEKGVKKGDIGGYIECYQGRIGWNILGHKGSCWIGENAIIMGEIIISGDALITGNAIVKNVEFNPWEQTGKKTKTPAPLPSGIGGNALIKDDCIVSLISQATIGGSTVIQDRSNVILMQSSKIFGNTIIKDDAHIEIYSGMEIYGKTIFSEQSQYIATWPDGGTENRCIDTIISGSARILSHPEYGLSLVNCNFSGDISLIGNGLIKNVTLDTGNYQTFSQELYDVIILMQTKGIDVFLEKKNLANDIALYKQRLEAVERNYHAYKYDVVRLIKYPRMADISNPEVLDFVHALNVARDIFRSDDVDKIANSVIQAEKLFLIAESKALMVKDTELAHKEKSKLKTANALLAIAHNNASSENEKQMACDRVLKELEGIILLEDKLINNLRISVGLKELTA